MGARPIIVSVRVDNPTVKKVGRFFMYKTWDGTPWLAEIIDNGNAFYHWQPGKRSEGHKDSIMKYIAGDGQLWVARIHDGVFQLALEGNMKLAQFNTTITYLSLDNNVYCGSIADTYEE